MATNLVSEIAKVLGPDVEARIASSLGLDKTVVQDAVEGGVPGLLAALIALVSKPQGATKLGQAVARQNPACFRAWRASLVAPARRRWSTTVPAP